MFDYHEYSINEITERVYENKVVHEHKAPTDESLRLLDEMTQRAKENILEAFKVSVSNIEVAGICYKNNLTQNVETHYKLNINGEQIQSWLNPIPITSYSKEAMIREVYASISNNITNMLIAEIDFDSIRR